MQSTNDLINNGTIPKLSENLITMEREINQTREAMNQMPEEPISDENFLALTLERIDNTNYSEELKNTMRARAEKVFNNKTTNKIPLLSELIPELF